MTDEQKHYSTGSRQLPKAADPYEALHEYLGSLRLYAEIAQGYTETHDIAGLSHSIRCLLAYAKAAKGELAAIIEQAIDEAGRAADAAVSRVPKKPQQPQQDKDEWWNE
jgi:hypothetical protein